MTKSSECPFLSIRCPGPLRTPIPIHKMSECPVGQSVERSLCVSLIMNPDGWTCGVGVFVLSSVTSLKCAFSFDSQVCNFLGVLLENVLI